MIAFEKRASAVLYKVLRGHHAAGPYLLPANICPIVPLVFIKAGKSFEFIDIDPVTLGMDSEATMRRCRGNEPRPSGIVYVRPYGAIFDVNKLFSEIKTVLPKALIIDDCCLCEPDFSGVLAPHVDIALYSTGYAKFVDVGEGGFGFLRDGVAYAGELSEPFDPMSLGAISACSRQALDARTPFVYSDSAWLDISQPRVSWSEHRARVEAELPRIRQLKSCINKIYSTRLPAEIQLPQDYQFWRFNIRVRNKVGVLEAIQRAGLFASGHYDSLPDVFGPGLGACAQHHHGQLINLFNDRYFSVEKAEELTDLLLSSCIQ